MDILSLTLISKIILIDIITEKVLIDGLILNNKEY